MVESGPHVCCSQKTGVLSIVLASALMGVTLEFSNDPAQEELDIARTEQNRTDELQTSARIFESSEAAGASGWKMQLPR